MMKTEEEKLFYIKSAFKYISDKAPEDYYKLRSCAISTDFRDKLDDQRVKKNIWFALLRELNNAIQYSSQYTDEEVEGLFKEIQTHPYFESYSEKEFLEIIFKNRKKLEECINGLEDDDVKRVLLAIFHLHQEARDVAIQEIESKIEDDTAKKNFKTPLKKLKLMCPELYAYYSSIFDHITKAFKNETAHARRFQLNLEDMKWYYWVIIFLLIRGCFSAIVEN